MTIRSRVLKFNIATEGVTEVGESFLTTDSPSAVSFPRVNEDNSVSYQSASNFREDLGIGYNPVLGSTKMLMPWGEDGDEIIRILPNDFVLQDEVLEYVTYIEEQLAATVPTSQLVVLNSKVIEAKASTWWSKMGRIILPIWASDNANKKCLKSGDTSGSFTNVTAFDGFVTSAGNGSYFDPGVSFQGIGASNSTGVGLTFGVLACSALENSFGFLAGTYNGTQFYFITHNSGVVSHEVGTSGSASLPDTARHGIYLASCPGGNGVYRLHRRRSSGEEIGSSSFLSMPAIPTGNPHFMAGNGIDSQYSMAGNYGSFFMGLGLTSDEATSFTLWLKDLWEGLTGSDLL